MVHFSFALALLPIVLAAPNYERATGPSVKIPSGATVVGSTNQNVDSFKGIPFAKPPVGQLRLKPPQSTTLAGVIQATGTPTSCPQFLTQPNTSGLDPATITILGLTPFAQNDTSQGEDCLTINVQRPANTPAGAKLPVLFWIFGGGFEFGSAGAPYDATQFINYGAPTGQGFVYVSFNYRVGGFGFLAGKEILKDGASNLGLLDQRLALEWVADNIASFGGDPSKVTIWGESAGAISVTDQVLLYSGNNKYKGKPLFRGAIMNSGSVIPALPVDSPRAQQVFDSVATYAGCNTAADKLACLRALPYTKFRDAANSVPGIFGYNGIALSYVPRPDGVVLADSPDNLFFAGKFAPIPLIIGDQEDEGTLFSIMQNNITNESQLVDYLQNIVFVTAPRSVIQGLVDTYPADPAAGSPFGTGALYNVYPEFKRLAAMQGDFVFTLLRRIFLQEFNRLHPEVPTWSYLSSAFSGTPILGTFHATDIVACYGIVPSTTQQTVQTYYLNFLFNLDPNKGGLLPPALNWPRWNVAKQLMNFKNTANGLITDNFRQSSADYLLRTRGQLSI